MQGFSAGSKLGAFSASRLHSCAYIDEYFGSSRAFSKTCGIKKGMQDAKKRQCCFNKLVTYQKNNSFEDNRRVQSNIQYVHRQFLKLLRRDLVEDPADLEGHQVSSMQKKYLAKKYVGNRLHRMHLRGAISYYDI